MPTSGGGDAMHYARPTPPKAYAYGYALCTNVPIVVAPLLNSAFKLSFVKLECRIEKRLCCFSILHEYQIRVDVEARLYFRGYYYGTY